MEVYLDNGATTKVKDEVITKICHVLKEEYGNPSSLHNKGIEAEKMVTEAKTILADLLKVEKNEIYFTSGGTESNNLALLGIGKAYSREGKHIIVSAIEHASVSNTVKQLEEEGFEITTIPVDSSGRLNLDVLESVIREDTILVSIMHVNNEIGIINPINMIGEKIKGMNPKLIFHVDAIQSFGKIPVFPKRWDVDALSISGHKFHGPKGIGALYVSKDVKIKPMIYGGNQQLGLRSGTENTPSIAGLGLAAKIMYNQLQADQEKLFHLKMRLRNGILNQIEDCYVNGVEGENSANHILNIRFNGVRGEVLLHALEAKKIYVSTGSACSSNKVSTSSTLAALGYSQLEIESSVRFSFSTYNTLDEIDYCIEQLVEIIPTLRKFIRK